MGPYGPTKVEASLRSQSEGYPDIFFLFSRLGGRWLNTRTDFDSDLLFGSESETEWSLYLDENENLKICVTSKYPLKENSVHKFGMMNNSNFLSHIKRTSSSTQYASYNSWKCFNVEKSLFE